MLNVINETESMLGKMVNSNLDLVLLTVGHLVRNNDLGNKNGCP